MILDIILQYFHKTENGKMDKMAWAHKRMLINTHGHILHTAPWQNQNAGHRNPDI